MKIDVLAPTLLNLTLRLGMVMSGNFDVLNGLIENFEFGLASSDLGANLVLNLLRIVVPSTFAAEAYFKYYAILFLDDKLPLCFMSFGLL